MLVQAGEQDCSGHALRLHFSDIERFWARVRPERARGDAPRL